MQLGSAWRDGAAGEQQGRCGDGSQPLPLPTTGPAQCGLPSEVGRATHLHVWHEHPDYLTSNT
jgi:hypothetical protein